MSRNRLLQCIFLAAAAAALLAAAAFHAPMGRLVGEMQAQTGYEPNEEFANLRLLQAMPGAIRVLLINYLWIESEQMKDRGEFYDAEQKTALICALQPRFPAVWANRAWNLAYNISVQAHTPWERWRWVYSGIELLRDKGLVYNPNELTLYRELGWIYYHKLGQLTDDLHQAYWSFHAAQFHRVLGSPPREDAIEAYRQWLEEIAQAPHDLDALRDNIDAAAFLDAMDAVGLTVGGDFLDAYNQYSDDPRSRMLDQPPAHPETAHDKAIQALITDPVQIAGRTAVLAFSRSKVLREEYRMHPDWMLSMLDRFGPMDWRLVWPHSLYWSSYGLYHCKDLENRYDKLTSARTTLFSLNFLITYNRAALIYNPADPEMPFVETQSDWRMIDYTNEAYKALGELINAGTDHETAKDGTAATFMSGHENFLQLAIQTLYAAGQERKGQEYLNYARRQYSWQNPALYKLPLERFVFETINQTGISNRQMMVNYVSGFLQNAYLSIAYGYDEDFQLALDRARLFWNLWNETVNGDPRKVMEPLELMQARIALTTLQRLPVEAAMSVWEYVPVDAQRAAYDPLVEAVGPKLKELELDLDKAFPEPPGMESFRKERDRYIEEMNQRSGQRPDQ